MIHWQKVLMAFILTTTALVRAEEYIEIVESSRTKTQDPFQARKIIQEQVISDVSERYIIEMIGDKKTAKNKNAIQNKIIKNSGKYIPFVKVGKLETVGDSRQMAVTLKISLRNLKQMLMEQGLLYEQEGPAVVIPMIALTDKSKMITYRWWSGEGDKSKNFLHQQLASIHKDLAKFLKGQGFYLRNPLDNKDKNLLPMAYQIDSLRMEDLLFIGDFFKAQIILKGDVRIEPGSEGSEFYKIIIRITAMHTGNGRVVAEIVRSVDTEHGVMERVVASKLDSAMPEITQDLATQMHEAWQKGTFGSKLVKLALRGNLEYQYITKFKNQVEQRVGEIKSIRERLFEQGQVTYEIDTSSGIESLVEKFRKSRFDGFKLVVENSTNDTIALRLQTE